MKKTFKIFIIAFLLVIYVYICKIDSLPNNIFLYNNEELENLSFPGISLNIKDEIYATSNITEKIKKNNIVDVKFLNSLTLKKINVNRIDETEVIPIGQISGLKLYTSNVFVVGMSEIKTEKNESIKPYINSGIKEGDKIVKIDNTEIQGIDQLIGIVQNSDGKELEIEYIQENELKICKIIPAKAMDKTYKLGLWVRDSAAGIGTLTFYEPKTGKFAALGHGITDIDTGKLVEISNGEFSTAKILSIIKGKKGMPRKNTRKHRKTKSNRNNI